MRADILRRFLVSSGWGGTKYMEEMLIELNELERLASIGETKSKSDKEVSMKETRIVVYLPEDDIALRIAEMKEAGWEDIGGRPIEKLTAKIVGIERTFERKKETK